MNAVHLSTKSVQDYTTPATFVSLCENRFGVVTIRDLAATVENARCPLYYTKEHDSLKQDWAAQFALDARFSLLGEDVCYWLNPPFKIAAPWMRKCAEESEKGVKIITLTLASVGSQWYKNLVKPNACTFILENRIKFEGQKDPFAKELMLNLWGFGMNGINWWDWKTK